MIISFIAAISENNVIGRNGDLPWRLPDDMKYFMNTTKGHHVLSGRKNYESFPEKYRPLPDRTNLIVTGQKDYKAPGAKIFSSIDEALSFAEAAGEEELFVIGGGEIYRQLMDKADRLYITHVHARVEGDTVFPEIEAEKWEKEKSEVHPTDAKHEFSFEFAVYHRK